MNLIKTPSFAFGAGAATGLFYMLYKVYKEESLQSETKEFYDKLKIGSYSQDKVEYLHSKEIKVLSNDEIYNQLMTYASFGLGTSINELHLKESQEVIHPYQRAIMFVDCMDAGMPYGVISEVHRCNALKNELETRLKQ